MTARGRLILGSLACMLASCTGEGNGDGDTGSADLCAGAEEGVLTLGQGVDGTFTPFEDGEDVTLIPAPQGGYGITTLIRTEGMVAGEGAYVDLTLDVEHEGVNEGTFFIPQVPLLCSGPDFGGLLSGIVAGIDPDKYQTNDDLLALDGALVDIVAIATDEDGTTATVRQPVTIRVGG